MPYKIVLQGDHGGVLDHVTVKVPQGTRADEALKEALHASIDEWELSPGDQITIMSMSAVEVENEAYWNNMLEEIRRR